MDQFSHDLTLALEETSLMMVRSSGVSRWGPRRRTRSTGNLPCAPQPTEDSSSSPTDITSSHTHNHHHTATHGNNDATSANTHSNIDGLDVHQLPMPVSDSDEKEKVTLPLRLPCKAVNTAIRLGTLESDSLNETNFSPARFYKPSSRRKRKIKRMSMEFDLNNTCISPTSPHNIESPLQPAILRTNAIESIAAGKKANNITAKPNVPLSTGTVRKRLLKPDPSSRSNVFFCGKRKRSNRDRYHDHETAASAAQTKAPHSSSMPRHTYIEEYRMRPRSYSSTSKPHSERLLPLNKGLLSKIERISQTQKTEDIDSCVEQLTNDDCIASATASSITDEYRNNINESNEATVVQQLNVVHDLSSSTCTAAAAQNDKTTCNLESLSVPIAADMDTGMMPLSTTTSPEQSEQQKQQQLLLEKCYPVDEETIATAIGVDKMFPHSYRKKNYTNINTAAATVNIVGGGVTSKAARLRARRAQQLQFGMMITDEQLQHTMDCSELKDFLSSSSLSSSSESEDEHRAVNDTDREGDDELTDWPGNEFSHGFKYDPKRKLTKKSTLPQIRSDDTIGEDDTLMSATDCSSIIAAPTTTVTTTVSAATYDTTMLPTTLMYDAMQDVCRFQASEPIRIAVTQRNTTRLHSATDNIIIGDGCGGGSGSIDVDDNDVENIDIDNDINCIPSSFKQIESEMSGETSNPFLSLSPPLQATEVREIRAGCRRIKGERAGFSIKLSVNERLARFLQDPRQMQIRLPDIEIYEHDSLLNLATLYSLNMTLDNGCAVLTKTINTTQSVNIDQQRNLQNRHVFLSDFKRRCYDDEDNSSSVTGESLMPHK